MWEIKNPSNLAVCTSQRREGENVNIASFIYFTYPLEVLNIVVYIAPIGFAGGTNVVNKKSAWVIDLLLDIKLCKDTTIANRGLCRELSNSKIYYYSKVCWYLLHGSTALPKLVYAVTLRGSISKGSVPTTLTF